MKIIASLLWVWLALLPILSWANDDKHAIEIRADRTVIYPQRLELHGEETLLDILEMYPDLMVAGFDDLLNGEDHFDGYQLRMDNVVLSGDTRLLLTQIKADLISKVQICDNAGVAKGRTGDGRVIDVNLLKAEEGAKGFMSLQGSTDKILSPSAQLRYGSEKTDIWSSMTLNDDYLHFQMTNRFSERDRLLSYVTHSLTENDYVGQAFSGHERIESLMVRLRYFHTFNEHGTELLTLLSWAHRNDPKNVLEMESPMFHREQLHVNSPVWLLELNTPLLVDNLTMMLGYEGDLDVMRRTIDQEPHKFCEESTWRVMNNDLYLQLNYATGPLRLTIGDRVMFYHYRQNGYQDNWSQNDIRNNFHVNVVLMPHRSYQIQAGFFRKFRNPSVTALFSEPWSDQTNALKGGNSLLEEILMDQYKVACTYTDHSMIASIGGSIYHTTGSGDYWTIDSSVHKNYGALSLTAGFNIYNMVLADVCRTTFANARVSSKLYLPRSWQLAGCLVWYSKDAPRRQAADGKSCYASFQLNKQLWEHWDLLVQWHDMLYGQRAACLAGIAFRF